MRVVAVRVTMIMVMIVTHLFSPDYSLAGSALKWNRPASFDFCYRQLSNRNETPLAWAPHRTRHGT
jgi:hypothetical protein